MDKTYQTVEEAIADVGDGAVIAIGGFFVAGVPRMLLRALIKKNVKDLTLTCGCGPLVGAPEELSELVKNRQLRKVIDSYGLFRSMSKGSESPFEKAVLAGEIELEVYPMGTLAEMYRAGGAGIAAFYTPTGIGTVVADIRLSNKVKTRREKKEIRVFNGREYILEYALKPDYSFIHAYQGDIEGNLIYHYTARNFNPVMAAAATVTIAEVENIVEVGELNPDRIHTPGIYVQRVISVPRFSYDCKID